MPAVTVPTTTAIKGPPSQAKQSQGRRVQPTTDEDEGASKRNAGLDRGNTTSVHEVAALAKKWDTHHQTMKPANVSWKDMAVEVKERRNGESAWCIILPDSTFRINWDFLLLFLLVYIAIVTPIRIGFFRPASNGGFLYYVELLIDICFCTDVFLNFVTAFRLPDGTVETRHSRIAVAYLRGFFCIDVVSSVPLDSILDSDGTNNLQASKGLKGSKMLKTLRFLKLAKMFRVVRAVTIFKRLEDELNLVGRGPVKLMKTAIVTMFVTHIAACGWAFVARIDEDLYERNSWMAGSGVVNANLSMQYFTALYWAVTTLTTVGYGDISPVTSIEIVYAILAMVAGGFCYGFVIAVLSSLVASIDANVRMRREAMDSIVSYMRLRKFPKELFRKVLRYYKHYYTKKTALDEEKILNGLSSTLRHEVAVYLVQDVFMHTHMFKGLSNLVLMKLVPILKPSQYNIDEPIMACGDHGDDLHIIIDGRCAAFNNKGIELCTFQRGALFGEFVVFGLLTRRCYTATAETPVELVSLSSQQLSDALLGSSSTMEELQAVAAVTLQMFSERFDLSTPWMAKEPYFKKRRASVSDLVAHREGKKGSPIKRPTQRHLLARVHRGGESKRGAKAREAKTAGLFRRKNGKSGAQSTIADLGLMAKLDLTNETVRGVQQELARQQLETSRRLDSLETLMTGMSGQLQQVADKLEQVLQSQATGR